MPLRVAALTRLIALTGCRPDDIKTLRWDDVDLGRRVLHLRDAKTGDRDVWLAEAALAVLRELPPIEGSPFVFPSRRKAREPRPVGEFRKPWKLLLEVAKIPHNRRRDMTRGYVHHVPEDVRRASEGVAASIAAALTNEPSSNVVTLAAAGVRVGMRARLCRALGS